MNWNDLKDKWEDLAWEVKTDPKKRDIAITVMAFVLGLITGVIL